MAVQKNLLESHETIFSGSKMMAILSVFPELNIHILTKKWQNIIKINHDPPSDAFTWRWCTKS